MVPSASFELKAIAQYERGTFTFDLNRRQAVQRTFAPQQFLGFLVDGIDVEDESHVTRVRFTDPFFDRFTVLLDPPPARAYELMALKSVSADVYYNEDDPRGSVREQFTFDRAASSRRGFSTPRVDERYRYVAQYNFEDNLTSGWRSKPDPRSGAAVTSYLFEECRPAAGRPLSTVVNLDPAGPFQLVQAAVRRGPDFDAALTPSVTVEMEYQDYVPGRDADHPMERVRLLAEALENPASRAAALEATRPFVTRATFTVDARSPEEQWFRVRADAGDAVGYRYRLVYRLGAEQQGRTLAMPWEASSAAVVPVGRPPTVDARFDFALLAEVDEESGTLAWPSLLRAVVEVRYADAEHGYAWERTLTVLPKALAALDGDTEVRVPIPVVDPARRAFDYTVTVHPLGEKRKPRPRWQLSGTATGSVEVQEPAPTD